MKKVSFLVLSVFLTSIGVAQNNYCKNQQGPTPGTLSSINDTRSDSINILKTTLNIDLTDIPGQQMAGNAKVVFKAKVNGINVLRLDLLSLTVDSVKKGNQQLAVTHVGDVVRITLPTTLNTNQTDSVNVYYHGQPVTDPSGYGGFYFSGQYAYSIGVGFAAQPHNFGRCWFPCFDNFVERCLFDFNVTTTNANSGVCNGTPTDTVDNGNGTRTISWHLEDEIPSYLACVSVAPFKEIRKSFPSVGGGDVPVRLYGLAGDTNKIKNSFTHLDEAFNIFEDLFGPYRFEKVGYVFVPFTAGAMEHATCISYPTFLINNLTTYETTMAHELSHMWFGDFVTCDKAEEMYLNEGFARYCEALFLEGVYGANRYMGDIRSNHRGVLNFAYAKDSGFYAIANVPQNVTYGTTTYEKGADVLHTLRSYMGDSLFFNGLKSYLNNHPMQDVNTVDLQTDLENYSGQNLDDFFNGWVTAPGYPQFSIDSMDIVPNGNQYNVTVFVRQKLYHAPAMYQNVPFNLTFKGAGWEQSVQPFMASNANCQATFTLPFYPVFAALNVDERISHAVTAEGKVFKQTGNISMANALISINPVSLNDSAYVYVEHNWVAADNAVDNTDNVIVSPDRYWRVSGFAKPGFVAKGTFGYNGRTNSASSGWLDNGLIIGGEDSLILMYRPGPGWPWKKYGNAVQNNQGNSTDKLGRFDVDTLKFGEYCLGRGDAALKVPENAISAKKLMVYPNPAGSVLTVQTNLVFNTGDEISIITSMGSLVATLLVPDATDKLQINLNNLAPGVYYLRSGNGYARFVVM